MKQEWKDLDTQRQLQIIASKEIIDAEEMLERKFERERNPLQEIATPWRYHNGNFGFILGGLHLIGGYSGHGKTSAAIQIAMQAIADGHQVGMASMEMDCEEVIDIMVKMAAGTSNPSVDFQRHIAAQMKDKFGYWDQIDSQDPEAVLQWVYAEADSRNCKLIVLDNLMMIGDITGESKDEKEFCAALATIAKQFRCAILLCHHFRKPGAAGENFRPGKEAFIGSSMMINICSSVSIIHKDVEIAEIRSSGFEPDIDRPDYTFTISKNRHGAYHGVIPLYPHDCRRFRCNQNDPVRPVWDWV